MLTPSLITIVAFCAALAAAQSTTTSSGPLPTQTSAPGSLIIPTMPKIEAKEGMPKAKVCNGDKSVCITVTDLGDAIDVMAEAPADAKWLGVGWGTGMPNADIVVGYVVNKQFIVSDRKASQGRGPPPVDNQQDSIPIGGGKDVVPGKWVSHFQRMKKTGDKDDTDVDLNAPVPMIFAYHTTQGVTVPSTGSNPELRATLTKHTNQGKLTLDMKDQSQIAAAKQSSTPSTTTTTSGSSSIVETSHVVLASLIALLLTFA